jgi:hypothetical protein
MLFLNLSYFVVIVFITLFWPYFFHETVQISEVDVRILVEIHGIAEGIFVFVCLERKFSFLV